MCKTVQKQGKTKRITVRTMTEADQRSRYLVMRLNIPVLPKPLVCGRGTSHSAISFWKVSVGCWAHSDYLIVSCCRDAGVGRGSPRSLSCGSTADAAFGVTRNCGAGNVDSVPKRQGPRASVALESVQAGELRGIQQHGAEALISRRKALEPMLPARRKNAGGRDVECFAGRTSRILQSRRNGPGKPTIRCRRVAETLP
jgi:hypothetical protein